MTQATETHGKMQALVARHSHDAQFITRTEELADQASRVLIQNDTDYDKGGDLLKFLKDLRSDVDTQRKEDTRPLREAVSEINGRYKIMVDKLDAAINRVQQSITAYVSEKRKLEQKRREDEALEQAERDPERADAYLAAGSKEVKPAGMVSTHGARTVVQRRLSGVEITDWSKVPDEYKMLDEKKAKEAIRAGVTIPGVSPVYKESVVSR